MPHKYDVFLQIAKKGQLGRSELIVSNKGYFIQQLIDENLITESKDILEIIHNAQSKRIYSVLSFCIHNNLDYAFYTKISTVDFLDQYFAGKKIKLSDTQLIKIRKRLQKDSFLIYFSLKPVDYLILPHTYFKELLAYFGKKYSPKRLPVAKIQKAVLRIRNPKIEMQLGSFIHTSLQLEGNLLTLRQTQQVLSQNVMLTDVRPKDILETTNYNQALLFAKSVTALTNQTLLEIHAITMAHEDFAGKFRKEEVSIKNNPLFKIAPYNKIESELDVFFSRLTIQKKQSLMEICKKAAYLHNQLQYIHPFIDGNSRTTRLVIQWFFEAHNVSFDVPLGFTTIYVEQTKGYSKRDDSTLALVFMLILISMNQRNK